MVVAVVVPRFSLLVALDALGGPASVEPVALAAQAQREPVVGEVSPSAEGAGVVPGMRVGAALSLCPSLRLVPPDPAGARLRWLELLDQLEQIGAAVESDLEGACYFSAPGLYATCGGGIEGVLRVVQRRLRRHVPGRSLGGADLGPRLFAAAAPVRFSAHVAALHARPRRTGHPAVIAAPSVREFLAPLPVALLGLRCELKDLAQTLGRLGIRTLGQLQALSRVSLSERFGAPGVLCHRLATGDDTPLRPRRPPQPVIEGVELFEYATASQLERVLELLIGRLIERPERRGRSIRDFVLSARLVDGRSWRLPATLRQASADRNRLRLALLPKLLQLPAPAQWLALEVGAFGPPARAQQQLADIDGTAQRKTRLQEALAQLRQTEGDEALLRVMEVDSGSPLPDRRAMLGPFFDPGSE